MVLKSNQKLTRHWINEPQNDEIPWYVDAEFRTNGLSGAQIKEELSIDSSEDTRGWSDLKRRELSLTLKFAPTVRTNNSITICGMHPIRHTQLMLPVVHSPEEFQLSFDLDCVAVYWDGKNVFASERALRAFNTRTNFVTIADTKDRARVSRMCKYAFRGFQSLLFEVCRHRPRCDVQISNDVFTTLVRNFKGKNATFVTTNELGEEQKLILDADP
ncbi:hypothetical protein HK096_001582, partial [Nowakowskiella sp. JEL0078]